MFSVRPYKRAQNLVDAWWRDDWFKNFSPVSSNGSFLDIKCDIKENDKAFIIEAEIPGINKEDLILELKDGVLTITTEKNNEITEDEEQYMYRERSYGRASRRFYVDNIAANDVTSEYKNGVLKIILPKMDKVNPDAYRIKID